MKISLNSVTGLTSKSLITVICLGIIFLVINYISGIERMRLDTMWNHHQAVNSWKLYEIDKNNLNPFSYDLFLPDLSGGRFVSFWDPPLPYVSGLLISKLLYFFGDSRFLASVKVMGFINLFASLIVFYLLLRELKLNKMLSLIFTFLLYTSRQMLYLGYTSLNLPGTWALILPIYSFLLLKRLNSFKWSIIYGSSLALSFLQNPYYGFFVSTLLLFPMIFSLFTKTHLLRRLTLLAFSFVALLFVIGVTKGPDIYKIIKEKPEDPENRDYIFKQLRVYRPWYHFIAPDGHLLAGMLNTPQINLLRNLRDQKNFDLLTLWFPDDANASYLGLFNMTLFIILSGILVIKYKSKVIGYVPYIKGYLLGAAINSRADIFIDSRHIVLPWYRLQVRLPFSQLRYFAIFAVILFFTALGYLFDKVIFQKKLSMGSTRNRYVLISLMFCFFVITFYDVSYTSAGFSCIPTEDNKLTQYLRSENKNRIFLHFSSKCHSEGFPSVSIPESLNTIVNWDARYYQIYHKTPIFAPASLSWFDNYRYYAPLKALRTMNSVVSDVNDNKLKDLGVQEIVLYLEYSDARSYWDKYLKPEYSSTKSVKIFDQSVVFTL